MSMPICSCAEFYGEHHPDCPVRARIAALEEENARYKEVLHYLRDQLLHSEKGSWLGALWRAIDVALFPKETNGKVL